MITIDTMTRRQFVRDYKLPIQIVQDPYFDYFLELFEEHFKSKTKYQLLVDTVNKFDSLDAFVAESKRIRSEAMDYIKNTKSYENLSKDKLDVYKCEFPYKINLYNRDNEGKKFVSIDLVKGNFQALSFYNKELLGEKDSYEEFMKMFTNEEYFIQSKQIRQVIFGNLMPKKQQRIQKFIMNIVKNHLIEHGMKEEDICASSPDEIVFEYDKFKNFKEVLNDDKIKALDLHMDVFTLNAIDDNVDGFIKRFESNKNIEIKNCNMKVMPEVIKFLKSEPLTENDLYFFDEGRIAQYKEPVFYK